MGTPQQCSKCANRDRLLTSCNAFHSGSFLSDLSYVRTVLANIDSIWNRMIDCQIVGLRQNANKVAHPIAKASTNRIGFVSDMYVDCWLSSRWNSRFFKKQK